MRSPACRLLPVVLLGLAAASIFGHAETPLATPHFEAFKYFDRPTGVLGLSLGTFAVIEGTERATSMLVGSGDFVVANVNGIKPARALAIETESSGFASKKLTAGTNYVLHGYEVGKWEGQPDGLPASATSGITQGGGFFLQPIFVVTSIEKINGATAPDAKPVDPNVPLAKPDFSTAPPGVRPVGVLGLPLGTYAVIKAHKSKPLMMEDPFVLESVNGVPTKEGTCITIPGVKSAVDESVTLRGCEAGEWGSTPELPKSEDPEMGRGAQQSFQFYTKFKSITCD